MMLRRHGFAMLDAATYLVAACAVVLTTMVVWQRLQAGRSRGPAAKWTEIKDWRTYANTGHRVGPANAPVTLVEFVDYQCPACAVFARTLRSAQAAHPNDLRIVFRHWPLAIHPMAPSLARSAECADRQGVFERFHNLVFQVHDSLQQLTVTDLARRAGAADTVAFKSCFSDSVGVNRIDQDVAAAKRLGGRGTPTILLNNRRLEFVPDSAELDGMIREIRKNTGRT